MKNKLLYFILAFSGIFLINQRFVFSQDASIEEGRLFMQKTGISGMKTASDSPKIFVDKEIKYVAGEDEEWFTGDDEIYHYFLIERDETGKILKKICAKAGEDTVLLTSDDVIQDYQIYEYSKDGKLARELSYDGRNKLINKLEYSYDNEGRKQETKRLETKNKQIHSMTFFYDDKGKIVKDVEYDGEEIEKYHLFEYDNNGNVIKAMECHLKHNGKGLDDVWFTEDDVVSSTKEFFYDENGIKTKENKYIEAGSDEVWFTEDDVTQYYVLFEYKK